MKNFNPSNFKDFNGREIITNQQELEKFVAKINRDMYSIKDELAKLGNILDNWVKLSSKTLYTCITAVNFDGDYEEASDNWPARYELHLCAVLPGPEGKPLMFERFLTEFLHFSNNKVFLIRH